MSKKVVLVIIDGWGVNEHPKEYDAIELTETIWMDLLQSKFPYKLLYAHGEHVGLIKDQIGNSEVGHLTIGAGRIVPQDSVRISQAIADGTFSVYLNKIKQNKSNENEDNNTFFTSSTTSESHNNNSKSSRAHIIGLLSDGGVHSHINHIKALITHLPFSNIYIHAISDGRDTAPKKFNDYLNDLQNHIVFVKKGVIASVAGRYYTMDRDKRYDRINRSYEMMTNGKVTAESIETYIDNSYKREITDEFIEPALFVKQGKIKQNDTLIFANFRADRMNQIFNKFNEKFNCYCMTKYNKNCEGKELFEKLKINNTLPEVISKNNMRQIHIAETEKYAHVTYFFNGGKEEKLKGEDRIMCPSPKVASYDLAPEMSTLEIAKEVLKSMQTKASFIVCNLAAPDMVGHTGNFEKTKIAIATTDEAIGLIYQGCKEADYLLVITADHGNAEIMKEDGTIVKKHTKNRVPFIVCEMGREFLDGERHSLKDVAPTILDLLGIEKPEEMTGECLLKKI